MFMHSKSCLWSIVHSVVTMLAHYTYDMELSTSIGPVGHSAAFYFFLEPWWPPVCISCQLGGTFQNLLDTNAC